MASVKRNSLQEKIARLAQMLPMDTILAAVPGDTITARAKLCGISRQTYYCWLKGAYRPNPKQALKLVKITGYRLEKIIELEN